MIIDRTFNCSYCGAKFYYISAPCETFLENDFNYLMNIYCPFCQDRQRIDVRMLAESNKLKEEGIKINFGARK